MEVTSERLTIPVGSATMGAYLARPTSGGPHPGVIVFMEVFGVNAHIRAVTDRIASEGYVALAPDVFHRTAPGIELAVRRAGFGPGHRTHGADHGVRSHGRYQGRHRDAASAKRCRRTRDRRHGLLLRRASHLSRRVRAAHRSGGQLLRRRDRGRRTRRRGATHDRAHTEDQRPDRVLLRRQRSLHPGRAGGGDTARPSPRPAVRSEVVIYPGVGHGFNCDERGDYDKTAADDAWSRTTTLFREELR